MATCHKPVKVEESVDENWNEHLGKLIEVFQVFLLDTLRVAHLICLLPAIEEIKDVAHSIHQNENDGKYREAANEFLAAIKRSDQPGKWVMFLDALKEVEDTVIVKTLLDERGHTEDCWLDDQANRKLIQLFSGRIAEHLNLASLLGKMVESDLILINDLEQLRSMIDKGKTRSAIAVLLLIMHRHNSDWYKVFMSVLCENDQIELAKIIDPDFVTKKCTQEQSQSDDRSSSLGINLGHRSPSKEKELGPKVLLDKDYPITDRREISATASKQMGVTCDCKCCEMVLTKITSLETEMADLKALLMHLVRN